jgi:acyl-[acyl-carrier-protein]-phospholipid O-acyltransferase/long-chain-fatty-acid--[acyl-carrier-protein] ligase
MSANQIHLLKTKRFLPLFLVQFLGAFNDNVFKNAVLILATFQLAKVYEWKPLNSGKSVARTVSGHLR